MMTYHLNHIVGEGVSSIVYAATHKTDGRVVALKAFRLKTTSWKKACEIQEIRALMAMRGKRNVTQLLVMSRETDGMTFFVTHLAHQSLFDAMSQHGPMGVTPWVRTILRQILSGLSALHEEGIIHRDLKPENVLLTYEGEEDVKVVVGDLGSSCTFTYVDGDFNRPKPNVSGQAEYVTTRFYRAPEVVLRSPVYGPKIDCWAAGCLAFECATGRPLFPAQNEQDLILKMCAVLGSPPQDDARFAKMAEQFRFDAPGLSIPTMYPSKLLRSAFHEGNLTNTVTRPSDEFVECLEHLINWVPHKRYDCQTALRCDPFLQQ